MVLLPREVMLGKQNLHSTLGLGEDFEEKLTAMNYSYKSFLSFFLLC